MRATPCHQTSRARTGRHILIVLAAVLVIATGIRIIAWRPARGPLEVLRAEFELIEGRLHVKGEAAPFRGVMIERYENGALKSRSRVADGRLHGVSEGWHSNGVLQVREEFVAGVSDGVRTKWHANGRKLSEVPIVAGKLHGTFRRWTDDGSLAEVISLEAGEPHGVSRAYYASGCLKAEATLSHGQVLQSRRWQDGEYPPTGPLARTEVHP